jgi:hypothetical protein
MVRGFDRDSPISFLLIPDIGFPLKIRHPDGAPIQLIGIKKNYITETIRPFSRKGKPLLTFSEGSLAFIGAVLKGTLPSPRSGERASPTKRERRSGQRKE